MCLGDIVEGEDAVAEFRQKECAKGDDGPERELRVAISPPTPL